METTPLTVAELIDYLQQFPPQTRVVLSGESEEDDADDYIALDCLDFKR